MERKHIALTEAQIIAAEKGELQLETRDGKKVVQLVWFRPPYDQYSGLVLVFVDEYGNRYGCHIDGHYCTDYHNNDIFVSEPTNQYEQKQLYEVGEIIEVRKDDSSKWYDAEHIGGKNGQVAVWFGWMEIFDEGNHRKKQKTVTLEGNKVTIDEAFEYLTKIKNNGL